MFRCVAPITRRRGTVIHKTKFEESPLWKAKNVYKFYVGVGSSLWLKGANAKGRPYELYIKSYRSQYQCYIPVKINENRGMVLD
jgi:hypothetical protein